MAARVASRKPRPKAKRAPVADAAAAAAAAAWWLEVDERQHPRLRGVWLLAASEEDDPFQDPFDPLAVIEPASFGVPPTDEPPAATAAAVEAALPRAPRLDEPDLTAAVSMAARAAAEAASDGCASELRALLKPHAAQLQRLEDQLEGLGRREPRTPRDTSRECAPPALETLDGERLEAIDAAVSALPERLERRITTQLDAQQQTIISLQKALQRLEANVESALVRRGGNGAAVDDGASQPAGRQLAQLRSTLESFLDDFSERQEALLQAEWPAALLKAQATGHDMLRTLLSMQEQLVARGTLSAVTPGGLVSVERVAASPRWGQASLSQRV